MATSNEDGNNAMTDTGITMVDLLKEEEELETEAAAVLGAGDDTLCTYSQGYVKRQALYSCLTCSATATGSRSGVCLGCSYHCHEGHDLVELYTKRNFRCDCGNSKFEGKLQCKLNHDKESANVDNKYNHNFGGNYCTCERPYPDPEDNVEDSMIQCIVCEDWYHGRHLGTPVPEENDYGEMICHMCAPEIDFIGYILQHSAESSSKNDEATAENAVEVDVTSVASPDVAVITNDESCKMQASKPLNYSSGAVFLKEDWRKEMCHCESCKHVYSTANLQFLIDIEDTVSHYETKGLAKKKVQAEQREMDALATLDRVTLGEVVQEYNNLSTSLRDYLKKFADNGKVVKGEDIKEFFSQLTANKKQKGNNGVPYFCK